MQQPHQGGVFQALMAQGFTPDQIRSLMELGVLQEEGGIISQEMEMAEQLRATPTPQGRYSGRTFVSSHPLEMVGAGLNRAIGDYRTTQGLQQQRENAAEKARLRAEFLRTMGSQAPAMQPGGAQYPRQPSIPRGQRMAQTYAYGTNPAPDLVNTLRGY